jgi:hypothetical protein
LAFPGVSSVLLAIGIVAGARSHHLRPLIVRGQQPAAHSERHPHARWPTSGRRPQPGPPRSRCRCICPSPGPHAARVRPTAKTKPSPFQRLGLHDPSGFHVRRDLRHCHPPVWRPTVRCCSPEQLVHRNAQREWGLHAHIPGTGGGAGRVGGADDDRRDWSGVDRNGPTRSAGDSPALFGVLGSARTGGHSLMKAMGFLRQRFRGPARGASPGVN